MKSKLDILMMSSLVLSASVVADENLEQITVTTSTTNLLGSAISASEGFVSEQEIEVRPLLRSAEIMELVPGMVATQHSGSGKATQYFLRGFNLDHGTDFATFIDNMPINMRTHGHGQGYTDLNFIIPELIQSLDYKKGPYYTHVGDFSGAGAAFFKTQSALDDGLAKITLGENQYRRLLVADSVATNQTDNLLYALEYQVYDGPWTDIDEDVEKYNALLKYSSVNKNSKLSYTLMAYDNQWNSADQVPSRAVEAGLLNEFGSLDTSLGGQSSRNSFSLNWSSQQAALNAYVIDYDLTLFSNFTYQLDNPVNGDQFEQVDDRLIVGGGGHYHFDSQQSRTTLGFDTRLDRIGEVGLYQTRQRQRIGAVRSDKVNEYSAGLFVQNRHDWTSKIRSTLGIRYDHFYFESHSRIEANIHDVDLSANQGGEHDNIISLKGSVTYRINDGMEAYFAAGQGFHSNDARGTTTRVDPVSGEMIDTVDPLVRSLGSEIGLRLEASEQLNASISIWQLSLDSELLFVGDAGNTEASRPSERYGIELTTYYRPIKNLTLDLEYAWSDAEFTDRQLDNGQVVGQHIPGSLESVLQLGATYEWAESWLASIRLRQFGSRPLIEDGSVESHGTRIVNLAIDRSWHNFNLRFELLNALDSNDHDIDYFYTSRLDGEPTEGVDDVHFHPIEPLTLRLTATYRF